MPPHPPTSTADQCNVASVASAGADQCNVAARSANGRQGWESGGARVTIHHHGSTLNNRLISLIRTSQFTSQTPGYLVSFRQVERSVVLNHTILRQL